VAKTVWPGGTLTNVRPAHVCQPLSTQQAIPAEENRYGLADRCEQE
jgi:hypothetical protein